jgi:hypothetical protein
MSPQVDAIFEQIVRLNEADRLALEQRLQEYLENEWRCEADDARATAHRRGIGQEQIDAAINEVRYGS